MGRHHPCFTPHVNDAETKSCVTPPGFGNQKTRYPALRAGLNSGRAQALKRKNTGESQKGVACATPFHPGWFNDNGRR